MAAKGHYIFIASMDVDPDKEDLFNEVYDNEHIPYLMEVEGVIAVQRLRLCAFDMAIGGEIKHVEASGAPRYRAMYEVTDPAVLKSDAWAEAVERGRWATEVRPYTSNRHHEMREIMQDTSCNN